jgi:hypothetical protein
MISFLRRHIVAIIIFIITVIIGLFVYKDYGIAWDEQWQRDTGLINYNFIFHGHTSLSTYADKDYGVAFELPLIIIEKLLKLKDSREIYLMRHIVTHLFFLFSAFILYLLIYILYKNRILGILGYLILLLSPLMYAHSFFNTKDIPFMSMFIICFFLFELAFQKWKACYFLLFGICTGLVINIRIMGVMFLLFVSVFMIIDQILTPDKKKIWRFYLIYLISSVSTLIIIWPYLWESPIINFVRAFFTFSKYPRRVFDQLMFGDYTRITDFKWYYIPVWFSITTPIPVIFAGLTGSILIFINLTKTPIKFFSNALNRNQLMYLFCFFGSIASVIILHSVLYNGWRQMYFIYPSFILLSIYGISGIFKIRNKHIRLFSYFPLIIIFVFNFTNVGWFMIRNHPFEHVYFNNFISHEEQYLKNNFVMDYWGTSYKQALEYVLNKDINNKINILVANLPGKYNARILEKNNRERLNYVFKIEDADYYISKYKLNIKGFGYPACIEVFNIKVLNSDIISVWKIKKNV